MTTNRTLDEANDSRLNDLYWNSSRTIDEIVDELSVGRNTLYSSIRPYPSGMPCSTCGEIVVFTNRTNRAAGAGICESCGMETIVPSDFSSNRGGNAEPGARLNGSGRWDRWRQDLDEVPAERVALIGGAAALGAIIGSVAVRAMRH
jgi:hypothetical protein